MLFLVPRAGQGARVYITHHLAFPSPRAPGHCSSTNTIKPLQFDLPNFKGSFGIHKQTNIKKKKTVSSIHSGMYFLSRFVGRVIVWFTLLF